MQKYQQAFQSMLNENSELFDKFAHVHENVKTDPQKYKVEFNQIGSEVIDVIRIYERRLCGKTESGQYGKFSTGLSQKFWDEIRKVFPKIDFVGIS